MSATTGGKAFLSDLGEREREACQLAFRPSACWDEHADKAIKAALAELLFDGADGYRRCSGTCRGGR